MNYRSYKLTQDYESSSYIGELTKINLKQELDQIFLFTWWFVNVTHIFAGTISKSSNNFEQYARRDWRSLKWPAVEYFTHNSTVYPDIPVKIPWSHRCHLGRLLYNFVVEAKLFYMLPFLCLLRVLGKLCIKPVKISYTSCICC